MRRILTDEEHAHFDACGYVRVPEAFDRAVALELQSGMWRELERELGILRDDRSTWRQPERDLKRAKEDPLQARIGTERLLGAIGQLLGQESWGPPVDWGRVLITFPEPDGIPWRLPEGPWHWDSVLADNVGAPKRLVVFTFFSEVRPRGGGTLVVSGSHRLLARFHDAMSPRERRGGHRTLRRKFLRWDSWIERLDGRAEPSFDRVAYFMGTPREVRGLRLRVDELTGSPGDAVLCHPLTLHTAGPNCLDEPRFMRIRFPGG